MGGRAIKSTTGRSIINAAKDSAINAGLNLAADVLHGKNVPSSTKHRLKVAGGEIADKLEKIRTQHGSSKPKRIKRPLKPKLSSMTKKKRSFKQASTDVFDDSSSEELY